MKLVSFSIENYRSITKARKIGVSDYTLLIGPNNEGKSNILRALALAMDTLVNWRTRRAPDGTVRVYRSMVSGPTRRKMYNWEVDFPIHLQDRHPGGSSKITLEFALTDEEVDEFKSEIKSSLNGTLPIQFAYSDEAITVGIAKPGRGSKTLNKKTMRISQFVSRRMHFEYIPAVRTARNARDIIDRIVQAELRTLDDDEEYQLAIQKIVDLQQPILDQLSDGIAETIGTFLPSVKSVELQPELGNPYSSARRGVVVSVDDGVLTTLDRKGDGVQSLVALAVMQHASERTGRERDYVFAIEEPEAHLHPEACHALRTIIKDLADDRQVVLASHSPLFVNRANVENNIIVTGSQAQPAEDIAEIRKVLGVQTSDNLRNAELVLLCEGQEDKKCLEAILRNRSEEISSAHEHGRFVIDHTAGAGNLSYKAGTYLSDLCRVHCFLDNDASGISAYEKAMNDHHLDVADFNFATFPNLNEAELEDLFDRSLYQLAVRKKFGVDIDVGKPSGKTAKAKWSERMKFQFSKQGKPWSKGTEMALKAEVADCVVASPQIAIHNQADLAIAALVTSLEDKL